jgi:hypothetical protein
MSGFLSFFHSSKNVMFTLVFTMIQFAYYMGPTGTALESAAYVTLMMGLMGMFVTGKGLEYGLKKDGE